MADNEFQDNEEIQEERGWLPAWWMAIFWGAVVFAVGYVVYFHGIAGWTQEKQYKEEVSAHAKKHPVVQVALTAEGANPYRDKADAVSRGQKTYMTRCAACHKADATGLIGPNLVDAIWLHGNLDKAVFTSIMEGIAADKAKQNPPKGPMPAHKTSLGAAKVLEVMAYLAKKNPSLKVK